MSLIVSTTSALGLTESGANSTFQVGQVKEKIAQEKGWDVAQQKLIYSGKCLICWRLLQPGQRYLGQIVSAFQ